MKFRLELRCKFPRGAIIGRFIAYIRTLKLARIYFWYSAINRFTICNIITAFVVLREALLVWVWVCGSYSGCVFKSHLVVNWRRLVDRKIRKLKLTVELKLYRAAVLPSEWKINAVLLHVIKTTGYANLFWPTYIWTDGMWKMFITWITEISRVYLNNLYISNKRGGDYLM